MPPAVGVEALPAADRAELRPGERGTGGSSPGTSSTTTTDAPGCESTTPPLASYTVRGEQSFETTSRLKIWRSLMGFNIRKLENGALLVIVAGGTDEPAFLRATEIDGVKVEITKNYKRATYAEAQPSAPPALYTVWGERSFETTPLSKIWKSLIETDHIEKTGDGAILVKVADEAEERRLLRVTEIDGVRVTVTKNRGPGIRQGIISAAGETPGTLAPSETGNPYTLPMSYTVGGEESGDGEVPAKDADEKEERRSLRAAEIDGAKVTKNRRPDTREGGTPGTSAPSETVKLYRPPMFYTARGEKSGDGKAKVTKKVKPRSVLYRVRGEESFRDVSPFKIWKSLLEINRIYKLRDGCLLVKVKRGAKAEKLLLVTDVAGIPVWITKYRRGWFVSICGDIGKTDARLFKELKAQNEMLVEVWRMSTDDTNQRGNPKVNCFVVTFDTINPPETIKYGGLDLTIRGKRYYGRPPPTLPDTEQAPEKNDTGNTRDKGNRTQSCNDTEKETLINGMRTMNLAPAI